VQLARVLEAGAIPVWEDARGRLLSALGGSASRRPAPKSDCNFTNRSVPSR
jgi:hypothetical protein